ncbi:MAG: alpha/beta hydrolase [Parafilimonas sp.]
MKKVIQYNNLPLVYYIYGKGIPVILIHGFAETNSIWKNQTEYLSNYCALIIPDLPGSGDSLLPDPSEKNLTIETLAESIFSIIKNENIEQCIMLGHSMGGYITLAFAEKYPEKLRAFGFVQSTAFADAEAKKQTRIKAINIMECYGNYAFLKTSTPALFADAFRKTHKNVVDELIETGKFFNTTSLQQYYYAMMQRADRSFVLNNNKLPVLFIMAEEDIAAPLQDVLKQVHLPEIAYIHILEKTGHMSMLEVPEKLNEILKNFINEVK